MSFPVLSPRSARRLLAAFAGLGLLGLGGCAGSATPVAESAALVQRAYVQHSSIHANSDAQDQWRDEIPSLETADR